MSSKEYLVTPKPAPPLNVPESTSTVDVRIINSTSRIDGNIDIFLTPHIKGKNRLDCPAYSFLITHTDKKTSTKTHTLFDLGVRKDPENLPPVLRSKIIGPDAPFNVTVEKNVAEILDEDTSGLGVKSSDIDAVIWSHHHWDHTGDMTTFPTSTSLIVGPGFKKAYTPAYPTKKDAPLLEADFAGREFREVAMDKGLTIGRCAAHDYFGDGSFYLLDTPGHATGHVCGLARVTSGATDTFILMGGDACHHGGEFRPTAYLPLPVDVRPWTKRDARYLRHGGACPGELLEKISPGSGDGSSGATRPFYAVREGFSTDHAAAQESIGKLEEFDAAENVFVVIAHDATLEEHLDLFPKKMNAWREGAVKEETRWLFASEFAEAVEDAA